MAQRDYADPAAVRGIELDEIREKSGGTRPEGDRTNIPLSGTGGIETDDGLDEEAEALRHAAEDLPDEPNPYLAEADDEEEESSGDEEEDEERAVEDQPVFDRASRLDR
jgi:hypothetical protein